ncbi:hypothetical protein HBB16_08075 [Pseudonocardia sp. MCCB 268]|nr:hypothetical protein [Pseudonocardia cytotoxica]
MLTAVFGDQTWATIAETTQVRTAIRAEPVLVRGTLPLRAALFSETRDGRCSAAFRCCCWLCTAVSTVVLLRQGRTSRVRLGFSRRLLASTAVSFAVSRSPRRSGPTTSGRSPALRAGVAALAALATSTGCSGRGATRRCSSPPCSP